MEPEQPTGPGALDAETLAFTHRMFDLARDGRSGEPAARVDAGLPVNLTNDKGDTLPMFAAYGHRGAGPEQGDRSAVATTAVLELPEMPELLQPGRPT